MLKYGEIQKGHPLWAPHTGRVRKISDFQSSSRYISEIMIHDVLVMSEFLVSRTRLKTL